MFNSTKGRFALMFAMAAALMPWRAQAQNSDYFGEQVRGSRGRSNGTQKAKAFELRTAHRRHRNRLARRSRMFNLKRA